MCHNPSFLSTDDSGRPLSALCCTVSLGLSQSFEFAPTSNRDEMSLVVLACVTYSGLLMFPVRTLRNRVGDD